jgi:fluoride exporter
MITAPERLSRAAVAATYARIAAGSACGGVLRWLAAGLFPHGAGDLAPVLFVNIVGSFLIGVFAAMAESGGRVHIGERGREVLMIGFCGGFTTFSAFSLATVDAAGVSLARAGGYAIVSLATWIGAVWAGHALASFLVRRGFSL